MTEVKKRVRIVIVGGGFAGVTVAKSFDKLVSDSLEVLLVDTKDFFENTGAIFKTFADPNATPPSAVQLSHSSYLRNVELVIGEATGATETGLVVRLGASASIVLPYDYLVIATGCSYPLCKEQGISRSFRAEWLIEESKLIQKAKSITVIGAGPTGIELVGNIISKYPPSVSGKVINLVHSHEEVLHRYPKKAREYVGSLLKQANVRLYLGHRVVDFDMKTDSITSEQVYTVLTDKGLKIDSNRVYVCTGPEPNTGFLKQHFPEVITKQGFVSVDKYLRMVGHENIYIAGDIADLQEEKLAERALSHAEIVVKNLKSVIKGKGPVKVYSVPKKEPLVILSLGINAAVATEAGHCVSTGEKTAVMKRNAELSASRFLHPKSPSQILTPKTPEPKIRRTSSLSLLSDAVKRVTAFFNFSYTRLMRKTVLALSKSGANVLLCTSKDTKCNIDVTKYVKGIARIGTFEKDSVWDFLVLLQGACVVVYQPPIGLPEETIILQLSMILEACSRLKIRKFIMPMEHCSGKHPRCALIRKLVRMIQASDVSNVIVKHDKELGNPFMKSTKPKIILQKTLILPIDPEIPVSWVNVNDVQGVLCNAIMRSLSVDKKIVDSVPSELFVAATQALTGPQMAESIGQIMNEQVAFFSLDAEIARARLSGMGIPEELHDCIIHPGRLLNEETSFGDGMEIAEAMKHVTTSSISEPPKLLRSQSSHLAINGENKEYVEHLLGHSIMQFRDWIEKHWELAPNEQEVLEDLIQQGGVSKVIEQVFSSGKELVKIADLSALKFGPALGRGASGTVYRGTYNDLPVAIKKFTDDYYAYHLDEFKREASLASCLKHQNLARCVAVSVKPESLLILFELFEHGSLENFLAQSPEPLPFALQQKFALEIAKAMQFLHAAGVIHRDLKASNVLLTDSMQIKITDFGTARPLSPKAYIQHDSIGTAQYMAPENLKDEKYSFPSDVYSYGMVLWQIAARKIPFAGLRTWEVSAAVSKGERPPLVTSHPFYNLITSCWQEKPAKRPTFKQIVYDIEHISSISSPPPPVTSRSFSGLVSFLKRSSSRSSTPSSASTPPKSIRGANLPQKSSTPSIALPSAHEELPDQTKLDKVLSKLRNPQEGVLGEISMHSLSMYSAVFTGRDLVEWVHTIISVPMNVAQEVCRWLVINKHVLCIAAPAGSLAASEVFPNDADSLFQLPSNTSEIQGTPPQITGTNQTSPIKTNTTNANTNTK